MAKTPTRIPRRKQDAVYWEPDYRDNYGQWVYKDPVNIKVRWDDTTEAFTDSAGVEHMSAARIYPLTELLVEGLLWRGVKETLTTDELGEPRTIDGTFRIKRFDTIPDVKANRFLFIAYL